MAWQRRLRRRGYPVEIEIGPTGGHGFGNGMGMYMEGWPKRAIDWFERMEKEQL